jgi:hypothetical protein
MKARNPSNGATSRRIITPQCTIVETYRDSQFAHEIQVTFVMDLLCNKPQPCYNVTDFTIGD